MKVYSIVLGLLVVLGLILFMVIGCHSKDAETTSTPSNSQSVQEIPQTTTPKPSEPLTLPPQTAVSPKETAIEYSIKNCNYITPEDIRKVLSLDGYDFFVTPTGINNTNSKCNQLFFGSKDNITSEHLIIYDVTDVKSEVPVEQALITLCNNSLPLSIGAYKSCLSGPSLFFGKGTYLVLVQCNGCEVGKDIEFAELIEARLK